MFCLNCGKKTTNPKFCSKSCAASYNNAHRTKKDYFCQKCGAYLYTGWHASYKTLCDNCNPLKIDWSTKTYGEIKKRQKYQAHSRIRDLARDAYANSNKPKYCANCGYDKHYEICHIKPIQDHDEDTPISVINDTRNLIALCRNCHWELDHKILKCKDEWKQP